jgi:hypothetical protein
LNDEKVYRLAMRTWANQKDTTCGTHTLLIITSLSLKILPPNRIMDTVFQISARLGS